MGWQPRKLVESYEPGLRPVPKTQDLLQPYLHQKSLGFMHVDHCESPFYMVQMVRWSFNPSLYQKKHVQSFFRLLIHMNTTLTSPLFFGGFRMWTHLIGSLYISLQLALPRIQWKASLPFLAFWLAQLLLLAWSIWSLVQVTTAVKIWENWKIWRVVDGKII